VAAIAKTFSTQRLSGLWIAAQQPSVPGIS
jgi:hypothetical protein